LDRGLLQIYCIFIHILCQRCKLVSSEEDSLFLTIQTTCKDWSHLKISDDSKFERILYSSQRAFLYFDLFFDAFSTSSIFLFPSLFALLFTLAIFLHLEYSKASIEIESKLMDWRFAMNEGKLVFFDQITKMLLHDEPQFFVKNGKLHSFWKAEKFSYVVQEQRIVEESC